jgi:hypothetical protein
LKEVAVISEQNNDNKDVGESKDNVILFPKTVDYYQMMLTRLLEGEQYGEAVDLLRFLITLDSGDPRTRQEWQALLGWLETMQPTYARTASEENGDADDGEIDSEAELLRQHINGKKNADSGYVNRLLDALVTGTSMEKILLALDQLTYIEHPEIDPTLKEWIQKAKLHPYVRFKALQALKQRGETGTLTLAYQGKQMEVEIEATPLELRDYPEPVGTVIQRVRQISDVNDPTLAYFAEQTWNEFLAYVYVSPVYGKLAGLDEEGVDVWAAALHSVIREMIKENAGTEDVRELYGITGECDALWKQACQAIKTFIRMKDIE